MALRHVSVNKHLMCFDINSLHDIQNGYANSYDLFGLTSIRKPKLKKGFPSKMLYTWHGPMVPSKHCDPYQKRCCTTMTIPNLSSRAAELAHIHIVVLHNAGTFRLINQGRLRIHIAQSPCDAK